MSKAAELFNERAVALTNEITNLTPIYFTDSGSKRVKIRYGPFTAPSSAQNNGMQDFNPQNVTMPCSDCLITWMEAGLEYPNGSYANSDTGMWLHHTVFSDSGQTDIVCPKIPNRFFASGNERTIVDLTLNGTSKTGYHYNGKASVDMILELMNETPDARDVVLTMEFEYLPSVPSGFTALNSWWLDVSGTCGGSDVDVPPNEEVFNFTAPRWKATTNGSFLLMVGHLHDGGTLLEVRKNNQTACDFTPLYGATPGYVDSTPMNMSSMPNMPDMSMPMTHISNMSNCVNSGDFQVGNEMSIWAYYNISAHMPMQGAGGTLEPVMGISLVYIRNQDSSSSGTGTATQTGSTSSPTASSTGEQLGSPISFVGLTGLIAIAVGWMV